MFSLKPDEKMLKFFLFPIDHRSAERFERLLKFENYGKCLSTLGMHLACF
jgi:hypothetical protein